MCDLSIIVVSYNHPEMLEKTLRTIAACRGPLAVEVFVVDNASTAGNVAMVKRNFPGVRLIQNSRNRGFAAANNQALGQAQGEFVLLLNPDIEVKDGALEALVSFMRRSPDAAAAGGKLFSPDGSLQMSCRSFYTPLTLLLRRTFFGALMPRHPALKKHLLSDWSHDTIREVDWVVGACLLLRRSVLERIGPLDERFFMYCEDVDICYRLKAQGFKTCYVPDAHFVHFHRRESAAGIWNRKLWWHVRSMCLLHWKQCRWGIKRRCQR